MLCTTVFSNNISFTYRSLNTKYQREITLIYENSVKIRQITKLSIEVVQIELN